MLSTLPYEKKMTITGISSLSRAESRTKLSKVLLWCVLAYAPWNFKVISSLPRVLDIEQWWAPLVFPEVVASVVAVLLVFPGIVARWRLTEHRALYGSMLLYLVALIVSSISNEINATYLTRVVVLQYLVPLLVFFLAVHHVRSSRDLRTCVALMVTAAAVLYVFATPVYFMSFHHFRPAEPLGWPASRVIYNRMIKPQVHDDPAMLYDNVTFGNFLNIAQLLVVLLPLAIGWLYTAQAFRPRLIAGLGVAVCLLHIFLTYSRGAILCTIGTLGLAMILFWAFRHPSRWLLSGLAGTFLALTFVSPAVPGYWKSQVLLAKGSTARERVGFVLRPLDFLEYLAEGHRGEYRFDSALARERLAPYYARMMTIGLGPGNYGLLIGLTTEAGTHNVFMDVVVNTGIPGLIGFVGIVVWTLSNLGRYVWRIGRRQLAELDTITGMSIAVAFLNMLGIGVLSLYMFQYLGTSTGGVLFWFVVAVSQRLAEGHEL